MGAGSRIFGKDYINSTPARELWIPLRLLPDGSISTVSSSVIVEGEATGGGITWLDDTTKDFEPDILEGSILSVVHGGVEYQRAVVSNTATRITFTTVTPVIVAGDAYSIMRQVDPMTPISRGVVHNQAYVTPNEILGGFLAPIIQPSLFRCQGAFSAAGVLSVAVSRAANVQVVNFNHGVALTPEDLFMFDCLVQDGTLISYRYSVNCTIRTFSVLEIPSAI